MTRDDRERTVLDLERELSRLIRRVRRIVGERARVIHPDLSPAAYLILAHMIELGTVRASAVVEAFDLDKGAVSRHVQTLVEFGLAAKERDPEDGRAWVVSPTDEGRARMADLTTERREAWGRRLEDWSDDELNAFVATLGRYNTSLDDS